MRKFIFVLFLIALITPVFAQDVGDRSLYYVNVPVERIYPTSEGYIVQYRNSSIIATTGIPNEWFTASAGKAEMLSLPPGRDWPTMSVFFRDGEFSHLKLYVHRSKGHWTWGNIPVGTDLSRFFGDKETFNFQF